MSTSTHFWRIKNDNMTPSLIHLDLNVYMTYLKKRPIDTLAYVAPFETIGSLETIELLHAYITRLENEGIHILINQQGTNILAFIRNEHDTIMAVLYELGPNNSLQPTRILDPPSIKDLQQYRICPTIVITRLDLWVVWQKLKKDPQYRITNW